MKASLDFRVRPACRDDEKAIVALLSQTLGWVDDERHRALFDWKHRTNPFGPSPTWVAEDDSGIIGSRTFMRWAFRTGSEEVSAVRAVDTATHPRAQGRGVFRTLTLQGVKELTEAGIGWAFNTPNSQSAPGYLKMGWRELGRLPVAVRPRGLRGTSRLRLARQPAELWSLSSVAGEDAAEVLADTEGMNELLAGLSPQSALRTARSLEFLRWRYGQGPIAYRAVLLGRSVVQGIALFRVRHRGVATEAVIADLLIPDRSLSARRSLSRLIEAADADYGICIGPSRPAGWIPVGARGPLLTWRLLARQDYPSVESLNLSAGDVELF